MSSGAGCRAGAIIPQITDTTGQRVAPPRSTKIGKPTRSQSHHAIRKLRDSRLVSVLSNRVISLKCRNTSGVRSSFTRENRHEASRGHEASRRTIMMNLNRKLTPNRGHGIKKLRTRNSRTSLSAFEPSLCQQNSDIKKYRLETGPRNKPHTVKLEPIPAKETYQVLSPENCVGFSAARRRYKETAVVGCLG
jgi:hypothetical protein